MLGRRADRALLDSPQTCHDHTSLRFSYAPGYPFGAAGRATTIWPQPSVSVWDAAILRRSVCRQPPPERGCAVQDLNTSRVGDGRLILQTRRWRLPSHASADLAVELVTAAVVALEEAIT